MQMLVSGQKIDIDAVELRTVKVIAGRFLNSFKEICKKYQQPTMYWTFIIYIHEFTGLLIQQLNAEVFAADILGIFKIKSSAMSRQERSWRGLFCL